MDKNQDPKVIVMDRSVFDRLMWSARQEGDPSRVIEHVRKFNPAYNAEIKAEERRIKAEDAAMRQRVREIVRSRLSKRVYLRATQGVYSPLIVLGRGIRDKRLLRVLEIRINQKKEVPVGSVLEDCPEGYQLVVGGQYKGYYMFAYDPNEPA